MAATLITGADVKDGSLTGADVRNGSLTGFDVKNGSLGGVDVRDGSLLAKDFKAGELSAPTTTIVRLASLSIDPQRSGGPVARCEAGEVATGGGFHVDTTAPGTTVYASQPYPTGGKPTGWEAFADNPDTVPHTVTAYVICAPQ